MKNRKACVLAHSTPFGNGMNHKNISPQDSTSGDETGRKPRPSGGSMPDGGFIEALGRVAERSIAAVLKTADGQPSVGSNPTPSAIAADHHIASKRR